MGADVSETASGLAVGGPARLRGGTFDLSAMPDTAPTVAALAPFASDEVRVTGVGFIRGHESDRIAPIVSELRRCGVDAEEEAEGFVDPARTGGPGRPSRPTTTTASRWASR